jgi:hypothetical protein
MNSKSAKRLYAPLATVLSEAIETHMDRFTHADFRYKQIRKNTKYLGFERLVVAEIYGMLHKKVGADVFLDFPFGQKERIDLAYYGEEGMLAVIEFKMYQSLYRNDYEKDFHKLKACVDQNKSVLAAQVHFHFYENRTRPVLTFFQELYASLPEHTYWRFLEPIGDMNGRHFLVLGFSQEAM